MKTIIAGSRIAKFEHVALALQTCPWVTEITEVVSGCARGADSYGELLAEEYNVPIKKFPAHWVDENGVFDRGAGYKRNEVMANYADALIAVDLGTRGIADMIKRAQQKNLKIHILKGDVN